MMNTTNTLEFNPIKTIRLINKEQLLKRVYITKAGSFGFITLLEAAENNKLTTKELDTIKGIHEEIVLVSDTHKRLYMEMKAKPETPRRYGKTQVQADIKKQGDKATFNQETALEIADLKTIVATLNSRITSDRYKGTEKISEADGRKIKAAIRDLKTKLAVVLKTK